MNLLSVHKKIISSAEKGFTLIELLVVIGILGILAASLVATIDPFEQIKKANDTKMQNVAVEFQTGVVRYFTSQNGFPWDSAGDCQTDSGAVAAGSGFDVTTAVSLDTAANGGAETCIDELIGVGELKQSFKDITGTLPNVFISETDNVLTVCYMPTSRAGQKDKATKYMDNMGDTTNNAQCNANGGNQDCYWCTK